MSEDQPLPMPRVERDPVDGHPLFYHRCAEVHRAFDDRGGKLPLGPRGWSWQPDGSLTPSIHCLECDLHGFWDGPERGWRSV